MWARYEEKEGLIESLFFKSFITEQALTVPGIIPDTWNNILENKINKNSCPWRTFILVPENLNLYNLSRGMPANL